MPPPKKSKPMYGFRPTIMKKTSVNRNPDPSPLKKSKTEVPTSKSVSSLYHPSQVNDLSLDKPVYSNAPYDQKKEPNYIREALEFLWDNQSKLGNEEFEMMMSMVPDKFLDEYLEPFVSDTESMTDEEE